MRKQVEQLKELALVASTQANAALMQAETAERHVDEVTRTNKKQVGLEFIKYHTEQDILLRRVYNFYRDNVSLLAESLNTLSKEDPNLADAQINALLRRVSGEATFPDWFPDQHALFIESALESVEASETADAFIDAVVSATEILEERCQIIQEYILKHTEECKRLKQELDLSTWD